VGAAGDRAHRLSAPPALALLVGLCLLPAPAQTQPAQPKSEAQQKRPAADRSRDVQQARAHFERGQRAYTEGKLEAARAAFVRAYALLPTPELSFNLGRVYERLGQARQAIAHYERYLREAGQDAHDRAQVEQRLASLKAAGTRLRIMLKQPPPTSDELRAEARRFFKRGARLYARGQYRGALAAFTAAHSLSKVPELYFNLALTSQRLDATRDAIDYYRAYLSAVPQAADRETVKTEIARLRALDR